MGLIIKMVIIFGIIIMSYHYYQKYIDDDDIKLKIINPMYIIQFDFVNIKYFMNYWSIK